MVDYSAFLTWVEDRFPFRLQKDEIKLNSIFTEDKKFHLWCNPNKNVYHCWKSDSSGTLVELVSLVDGIDPCEALTILEANNLRDFDKEIAKLFKVHKDIELPKVNAIKLPPNTVAVSGNYEALTYLKRRKIPAAGMKVCTRGRYRNRIIIPYYDREGEMYYWNGRDYLGKSTAKYMGPQKDVFKVGKEDVLYFYRWSKSTTECIYLTEGELDAISLSLVGLCGSACGGKVLYENQERYLESNPVCLSFDNDERGKEALHTVGTRLLRNGRKGLSYVRPPTIYKDWNQMLVERKNSEDIVTYILKYQRPYDHWCTIAT